MKAQKGSTGMLYSFFNLGDRRGGWPVTTRPLYPRERNPLRIIQEAGLTPGQVWMSAENLAPSRDSISFRSSP